MTSWLNLLIHFFIPFPANKNILNVWEVTFIINVKSVCRQNKCTESWAQTNPARGPIKCMIEKFSNHWINEKIIETMTHKYKVLSRTCSLPWQRRHQVWPWWQRRLERGGWCWKYLLIGDTGVTKWVTRLKIFFVLTLRS